MVSFAGSTLMGSMPVAARALSMSECTGRSIVIAAHRPWQIAALKPATGTFTVATDANRTRWPRDLT